MKAYQLVQQHIEEQILEGMLTSGALLPPERELAAALGVSRTAVREALRTLEAQGLVTSNVGAGPESGTRISAHYSPSVAKTLQLHVALAHFPIDDVVETRIILEKESVRLACEKADEADLSEIRHILTQMDEPDLSLERFNQLDAAFHVRIAEVSGNSLSAVLTSSVRYALSLPIKKASEQIPEYSQLRSSLIQQHHGIFDAIAAKNTALAVELVENHIRTAYAILPM